MKSRCLYKHARAKRWNTFLIKFFWIAFFPLVVNCSNDERNDFIIQDFGAGKRLAFPDDIPYMLLTENIDLNADGHPDYLISLSQYKEDGIYYKDDANYITIQGLTSYLKVANPYEPMLLVDKSKSVRKVGDIVLTHIVRYEQVGQEIANIDSSQLESFLVKVDELDAIQPSGVQYIPLVMQKNGSNYFGWMEAELDLKSITIKRIAFCTTPEKEIRIGQVK
jgi:hypothetical protein